MRLQKLWLCALGLLFVLCTTALIVVSKPTCDEYIPILLSRSLTTDPFRGLILIFCLGGVGLSFFFNSTILFMAILGFLSAFLVSMFDTNAHDFLILLSSFLVLWECKIWWGKWLTSNRNWIATYIFCVLSGITCIVWMTYSIVGCQPDREYTCQQPFANNSKCATPPESIICERCSWFYISEYLFFYTLFLLVYWKIPPERTFQDHWESLNEQSSVSTGTQSNEKYLKVSQLEF